MAQVYLFTELYLLLWAGILLSFRYGTRMLILINLRNLVVQSSRNRNLSLVIGGCIVLGLCFFPIDPGPDFLGDLIPSLTVTGLLIFQALRPLDKMDGYSADGENGVLLGYLSLGVAAVHLLFPSIVLI